MICRIYNFTRSFHSLVKISKACTMNQETCYFRYIQNEDKVNICFLFQVKDSVRQFNLSRKSTEKLDILCTRIATNVQKLLHKKTKKSNSIDDRYIPVKIVDETSKCLPPQMTCLELFDYKESRLKIKIKDNVYDITFNAPWILNIALPKSILTGFPVYPENFETQFIDTELCTFNWYRGKPLNKKNNPISDVHIDWELIKNSYFYTPSGEDIGLKLKLECVPANKTCIGPVVEEISNNVVEAGPGPCPFDTRHRFTATTLKDKSFRCVSYNILADLYCDSDYTRTVLHPYCPPYALQIDYRKQLILKELLGYHADIICLQEVDHKVFLCLSPIIENSGLSGRFYKKGKTVAEGLTCFYNKQRFQMLEDHTILLANALKDEPCLKVIWQKLENNKPLLERLLDRATVASATVLQSMENVNEILIVGNTHLYFHPDADHIRLIQGGIFIHWIRELKKNLTLKMPNKRISVILCGDYNSVPSCGIYQLYTTGVAPETLLDWKSNVNEAVTGLSLQQDIQLDSACGTPQYTNFTEEFADCLDYIFYEKSNIAVEQVIPFPSVEELKAHTALPSIVFPSDHIAIVSDLKFIDIL